jgi:microcystin-dependent protein
MTARNYSSTAETKTLSTGVNDNETTIILNTISTLPSAYPYTLVIDVDAPSEEIVTVVASAGGNSLTVVRGQDTTTAIAHDPGAVVKHMITPRDLREPQSHIEASGSYEIKNNGQNPAITTANIIKPVHGIAAGEGNVVGTAKSQTLTNKTISLASNTVTGTTAEFNTALTDGNFATIAGTETLTNKILTSPTLTSPTFTGTLTLPTNGPGLVPVGTVISTALSATVSGWLLCDGSNVSRTTYAGLFAAIGTTYGSGDGSTTFAVPNLKGKIPVGRDAAQIEFDVLGEIGGEKTHTHTNPTSGSSGAHTHSIDPPSTTSSAVKHTHTVPVHTHSGPSHNHTGPSHSHTMAHKHNYNPPSTTTSSNGSHAHDGISMVASASGATFVVIADNTSNGSHTHTLNIGDNDTDGSSAANTGAGGTGNTGLSGTGATGGPAYVSPVTSATSENEHSHTTDIAAFTSGPVSAEHTHTQGATGPTSSLQPYIVLNYLIKH